MGRLDGKVAIVTGAGQGVGRGIALALAREGAAVTVAGRTLEKVERTAKDIADADGRALPLRADVSERHDVDAMVAATVEAFGTVDILVNNAQSSGQGPLETLAADDVQRDFSTGPLATLYCMQACLPYLKQHGGTIINLGSSAAVLGNPTFGAYAMAKEAIRGLTKVAAREWGQHGITVNVICPMSDSPASDTFLESHPEHLERILKETPLGRMGSSEDDIGGACVALATDLGYLTGATLMLDGGRCILR
jgi:NAD(P)-dependent dehydrogenase (short-subunit alcohol dehydrogenase family)